MARFTQIEGIEVTTQHPGHLSELEVFVYARNLRPGSTLFRIELPLARRLGKHWTVYEVEDAVTLGLDRLSKMPPSEIQKYIRVVGRH